MENVGHKKGIPSGCKQKEHQDYSREGKMKWKGGKDNKMKYTSH
jgi:hypothetical protein